MRRILQGAGALVVLFGLMPSAAQATILDFDFLGARFNARFSLIPIEVKGTAVETGSVLSDVSGDVFLRGTLVGTFENGSGSYTQFIGGFPGPTGPVGFGNLRLSFTDTHGVSGSLGFLDAHYGGQTYVGVAAVSQHAAVLGTPGPIAGAGLVPLLGLAGAYLFGRKRLTA